MQEVFPRCWMSTILLFDRLPGAIFSAVLEEVHSDVDSAVCYPPVPGQAVLRTGERRKEKQTTSKMMMDLYFFRSRFLTRRKPQIAIPRAT